MTAQSTTTRRAALAALVGAPAFAATFGAAVATGANAATLSDGVEPGFARLVKRWRDLEAVSVRFHRDSEPTFEALRAARERWENACEKIPHVTTACEYETMDGHSQALSTARKIDVGLARSFHERPTGNNSDFDRACQELWEAVEQREAAKQALRKRFDLDALESRARRIGRECDKRGNAAGAALNEALAFPAASLATILAKVSVMDECGLSEDADPCDFARIVADLRRVAVAGRA
jgi:hypothetical protein